MKICKVINNIVFYFCLFGFVLYGCMPENSTDVALEISEGSFTTPLEIPIQTNQNTFLLEAGNSPTNLLKDKTSTNANAFNKGIPVIIAKRGDQINVNYQNNLSEESNIHWHGIMVPSSMDGHPKDAVPAGQSRNYSFTINQRASTAWFHPHPHMKTAKQVFSGLAGMFIINDEVEIALNLPAGEREIPLVLSDKRFSSSGDLDYNPTGADIMRGYLGDKCIVNNISAPYLDVKTAFYRFRIVNSSNARIYDLALSNGQNIIIIGNDGGLLEKPIAISHALLSPGERLDVLIDFTKVPIGSNIFLQSNANDILDHGNKPFKIMKFNITEAIPDEFVIPTNLSNIPLLDIGQSKRNRAFALPPLHMSGSNGGGHMAGSHTINGRVFDMDRIDETVNAGDIEVWEFDNTQGGDPHPMHLHGVLFQVLDKINGTIMPYERGWKDTILIKKGESVKIIVQFPSDKGVYLMHCHNLEHEDDGMMLNFEVK